MKLLKYTLFGLILAYVPMWSQLNSLLGSLGQGKAPITVIRSSELTQLIKAKTGVEIVSIKISETDKLFGMMIGIPGYPQLLLSRSLYESFSSGEIEYVLLHEAGHYALAHSVKELLLGLVLLIIGVFLLKIIIKPTFGLFVAILMGIIFGVGMIRFGAFNELEADNYTVTRMTNPEGMIMATEKFRGYYGRSLTQTDNKILQWMFYRGNHYDNRIKMANDEILRRKR